jgi:AcrR family transcriptional regulator
MRRILEAAESEFAAKGFDGARLAAIARAAGVQQALIHHYFDDKAGLYRQVVARAVGAMTAEGWQVLDRLAPPRDRSGGRARKRFGPVELRALAAAFVDVLLRFYSQHSAILHIVRLEGQCGGPLASEIVKATVKPQFDDIVARLEDMQRRGEVRLDVEVRHLCISAVAMACFTFQDQAFLACVWPVDPFDPKFIEERKREIVETILARALPR